MSLTNLALKNKHERDSLIEFQDEGHIYTIWDANRSVGDTGFTSVTTFVHSLFEEFDADKIITGMMSSSRWPQNKYFGMTREEIKKAWDDKRDTAAAAGTKLHYDIECFYNNLVVDNSSIEYKYFMDFYKNFSCLVPYRTEWIIFHEELRFAGSIDMVFSEVKMVHVDIYDWKTS